MNKKKYVKIGICLLAILLVVGCSNRKNTSIARAYHSVNTRYNIHFNAEEAYDESLQQKTESYQENLSDFLPIYPDSYDTTQTISGGSFEITIDKTTKAIKLHSIKVRPRRDRSRMQDPKYKEWVQQKEFNPFLKNTWMLLGKAEFQSGNYLRAISTFMYITKIYPTKPDIVVESRLWIARSYTAMGWMYEAEDVIRKLEQEYKVIPKSLEGMHASVKANFLVKSESYSAALPFVETAIDKEKNNLSKIRMRYLLGQIYAEMDKPSDAYEAYKSVKGLTTPHLYGFNADLHQIALSPMSSDNKMKKFNKMASKTANKEYLDQIYYAAGNLYLQKKDTTQAVKYFRKAIKESTRNGYDKALVGVTLGDIYFDNREFVDAQPYYADALGGIKASDKFYKRVYERSSVLDELVIHLKVLHEQDSLQHLASLPEAERTDSIKAHIERIKKEEIEKAKEEQLEKQKEERESRSNEGGGWDNLFETKQPDKTTTQTTWGIGNDNQGESAFYFYNAKTVEQGKIAFAKKWGKRKLEDDWRRKDKKVSLFGDTTWDDDKVEEDKTDSDTETENAEGEDNSDEIYTVEYYLKQLPLTAEAKETSDKLVEDALFKAGLIYKDRLEDYGLAIDAFEINIRRFPQSPNLEDMYYQLMLINMKQNNRGKMDLYRDKILAEFPEGIYAIPLNEPDYEWNFRHMGALQDSLYRDTYTHYLLSDVKTVRSNYNKIRTKYPFGYLMPKFMLLNALSYAQTRDVENLSANLKSLVEIHPKSDVAPLAQDILDRIKDGQILLSDGTPIISIDWTKAFVIDAVDDKENPVLFADKMDDPHILILNFPIGSVDRNELLYNVADYNFSNYLVQVHDLSFERKDGRDILKISGFRDFATLHAYVEKAFRDNGLFTLIDKNIFILPISRANYDKVLPRLGLTTYMDFYKQHYGNVVPDVVDHWGYLSLIETPTLAENVKEEPEIVKLPEDKQSTTTRTMRVEKDAVQILQEQLKSDLGIAEIEGNARKSEKDNKDINLGDILTKEQTEAVGKVHDLLGSADEMLANPVDGIKSLFDVFKKKGKLTDEEKEWIQEQKNWDKAVRAKEKAKQDSIATVEKALEDSIQSVKQAKIDAERAVLKAQQDEVKAIAKAKEDAKREKEEERKARTQELREKRKQKERETNELRRTTELERAKLLKEKETERKTKLREKENQHKAKQREQEGRRKEMENKRKK